MKTILFAHNKYLFTALCTAAALFSFILLPAQARADDVAIDESNFPDKVFREYVASFDTNEDGILSAEEISCVEMINLTNAEMTSVKGIEFFSEITSVDLSNNKLTEVDFSKNTKLYNIYCPFNELTDLVVANNPELKYLSCQNNKIKELDLGKNPLLETLYCYSNKLSSLDLSSNTALRELECNKNDITELDLSNNPEVYVLDCSDNKIKELDFSNNKELYRFSCDNNRLTGLDLTVCPKIISVSCSSNQIKDLMLTGLSDLKYLSAEKNRLTGVDLTGVSKMDTLVLSKNDISGIDLSPVRKTSHLDISFNKLSKIDLSKAPGLTSVYVEHNNLSSINISKNNNLFSINCSYNKISKIDISKNPRIRSLVCDNNKLTSINISGKTSLDCLSCCNNSITGIDLSNNPDLYELYCYGNKISKLDISKNAHLKRAVEKGKFTVGTSDDKRSYYIYSDEETFYNDGDDTTYYYTLAYDSDTKLIDGSGASLKLDKSSAAIVCGKTLSLKPSLSGSKAKIAWTSSDESVAVVDQNGKINAKMAGMVLITATAGSARAGCVLTVLYKDVTNLKDFWFKPTNALTNMGIVKGYDKQTNFKPANECTRAQMLTFIWRLAGSPEPASGECIFPDVKESDYFFKPVLWAVEKEITTGYTDGTFKPQNVCTRAQTVTFLWRLAGKPAPSASSSSFKDVKEGQYFYEPVLWAYETKIVAGYNDGTFKPQGKCLRRQMVTFLYKFIDSPYVSIKVD